MTRAEVVERRFLAFLRLAFGVIKDFFFRAMTHHLKFSYLDRDLFAAEQSNRLSHPVVCHVPRSLDREQPDGYHRRAGGQQGSWPHQRHAGRAFLWLWPCSTLHLRSALASRLGRGRRGRRWLRDMWRGVPSVRPMAFGHEPSCPHGIRPCRSCRLIEQSYRRRQDESRGC